MDHVINFHIYL